jgi:hypothetical protein
VLAEAMHEVLSSAAAIRSTADILVREADLDPAWRGRFHRNLHEEAERLAGRATALLGHFEAPDARGDRVGHADRDGGGAVRRQRPPFCGDRGEGARRSPAFWTESAGMDVRPAAPGRADADALRRGCGAAAARGSVPAARGSGFDPTALLALGAGTWRWCSGAWRACHGSEAAPGFGLAVCDASGALLFRRRLASFSIPRFGPGCPLWPLYAALARPGQPDMAPGDARRRAVPRLVGGAAGGADGLRAWRR